MKTIDSLEARGLLSRSVNAIIGKGAEPLDVVLLLDSIKADLLMSVPYKALADQEEEMNEIHEEGNPDV